ncbi:MAG: cell envelope integrity protein CreD [Chitinophagaceae bacterium]
MENTKQPSFWQTNKILFKGFLIGFLVLVLLIPTLFINNLIQERTQRAEEVKREITDQWAGKQEIRGPILSIPYWEYTQTANKDVLKNKRIAYFLPNQLDIDGTIHPQKLHRSIFEMVVYTSTLKVAGHFDSLNLSKFNVPIQNFIFEESKINFGINDFRGINEELVLHWNNQDYTLSANHTKSNLIDKGLSVPIRLDEKSITTKQTFMLNIDLRGAEGISFLPFGKRTKVKLQGQWPNPSFEGRSPVSKISDSAFNAAWTMLHVNRAYPQEWLDDDNYNLDASIFGVNLLQPINHYSKNMRTSKYAILIILLTFVIYFFIELFQKKSAHPIQYVLVGFALCIFYTLLLSFSEWVGFNWAYIIASISTVLLLGFYTSSVFQSNKSGLIFSIFLSSLYLFIFSLIQLQDRALLFGSIGLFCILALIMYASRKINWYNK